MSNIKNLVFSGGGVKIFIFAGCLKYMYENNLIENLETICGTSTGSIISTAVALDYNITDIIELLIKIDFTTFSNINSEGILNFFEKFGVDNTDEFERVFRIIIKAKTGNEDLTFKELFEATNKKLVIYSTNLNKMESEYFDYEKTPDYKIIDALISSISIPILFCPKKMNENFYIDGALTNHYPIEYFDNQIENTLGFVTINNTFNEINIQTIEEYFLAVSLCSMNKLLRNTLDRYKENSVLIDSEQNLIEFDLALDKKHNMINLGYALTKDYFENKVKPENQEKHLIFLDKETQTETIDFKPNNDSEHI
jgi:predicted acylesterase/phospholipase RssA